MSLDLKSEDRDTLRLKLRTVNRLIERYERGASRLWGKVSTQASIQEQENPERLLEITRDATIPIAEAGIPQSLIQDDLKAARSELGAKYEQELKQICHSIAVRAAKVRDRQSLHLSESQAQSEILAQAADIVRFVSKALEPAKVLRDRLINELRDRTNADKHRVRKALKRKRDQRIRALCKEHVGASYNELAKIAGNDARIKELGEPVSKDIVREALNCRKARGATPKRSASPEAGSEAPPGRMKRGKKRS